MGESEAERLLEAIRHYQKGLERYALAGSNEKMLHAISRLARLPIKMAHLEETGIGRTVNQLKKIGGEVGDAARSLVDHWKDMVKVEQNDSDGEGGGPQEKMEVDANHHNSGPGSPIHKSLDHNDLQNSDFEDDQLEISRPNASKQKQRKHSLSPESTRSVKKYKNSENSDTDMSSGHNSSDESEKEHKRSSKTSEKTTKNTSYHSERRHKKSSKTSEKLTKDTSDDSEREHRKSSKTSGKTTKSHDNSHSRSRKHKDSSESDENSSSSSESESEGSSQSESDSNRHKSKHHRVSKSSKDSSDKRKSYKSSSSKDRRDSSESLDEERQKKDSKSSSKDKCRDSSRSSSSRDKKETKIESSREDRHKYDKDKSKSSSSLKTDHKKPSSSEDRHKKVDKKSQSSEESDKKEKKHSSSDNKYKRHDKNDSSRSKSKEEHSSKSKHREESSSKIKSEIEKDRGKDKETKGENNEKRKDRESSNKDKESTNKDSRKDRDRSESGRRQEEKDTSIEKSKDRKSSDKDSSKKSKDKESKKDDSKHASSPKKSDKDTKSKEPSSKDTKEKSKSTKTDQQKGKKHTFTIAIDSESGTSFADALGMLEPPRKIKKKQPQIKEIDSDSGASFADALGMCAPNPSKSSSKKSKTNGESSTQESSLSSKSAVPKLLKEAKLEPLDINVDVLLPPPNYKPLGAPIEHGNRICLNGEDMLSKVISNKNQRTKVYSGNKNYTKVPSLFDICSRILQDNLDALEFTGGVPYSILKPILEKANPDQLYMLEHHNPYLIDDTDELWQLHCQKDFKNKKREELESWREMYMRCLDEREMRLKALTANIKQSQDKSLPVRTTKMAFVDDFVKPPRNILRKQVKNGTTHGDRVPLPAKKKELATAGDAGKVSVPNPVHRNAERSSTSHQKPKKAPLMAKLLSSMKGCKYPFGRK